MKKAILYTLLLANLCFIGTFWFRGSSELIGSGSSNTLLAFGRLTGLLLAFSTLMQLMLIGRVKWIESWFGLDRLSRVHKWNGYSTFALLLLHPQLIVLSYAQASGNPFFGQLQLMVTGMENILAALIATILLELVVIMSVIIVRKRLKYETWYSVHLLTYAAIILAFGHQINLGGDFLASNAFTTYWQILYSFVATNFIWFRFLRPLYHYNKQKFTVAKITQETYDTLSVYIRGNNLDDFPVKPGQFIIVRFLARPYMFQAHPFSVSFVPKDNLLRITVKQLGDFTKSLTNLKAGTKVLIDGPHGVFTSQAKEKPKTLLIAGGVGITPLRALAEQLAPKEKDMVLLYGNKTQNDIIFKQELEQFPLETHHILSNETAWNGLSGYIDREKITTLVPDYKERDVYLCGPPVMMNKVRATLLELGLSRSQIHWEKFSL